MANRSRAAEQQQNMARPKKRFSTATDYGPSEHTPDGASEDQEWNSPRMPMTERVWGNYDHHLTDIFFTG